MNSIISFSGKFNLYYSNKDTETGKMTKRLKFFAINVTNFLSVIEWSHIYNSPGLIA